MADWPDVAELKRVVNVEGDNSDEWDTTLGRVLFAAINQVKHDIGEWDEDVDEPSDAQAQAALRLAELVAVRPTAPVPSLALDPTYLTLLFGSRRRFGFS